MDLRITVRRLIENLDENVRVTQRHQKKINVFWGKLIFIDGRQNILIRRDKEIISYNGFQTELLGLPFISKGCAILKVQDSEGKVLFENTFIEENCDLDDPDTVRRIRELLWTESSSPDFYEGISLEELFAGTI